MLKDALLYANFGWAVFPLSPNSKIPHAGSQGCKDATKDEIKIKEMFTKLPGSNIAVATGSFSGIFVLDVDNKSNVNGSLSLELLESKYGKLPSAPCQLTPSGGKHYIFKHPISVKITNSSSNLGTGLDVRGDGGYIVCAPSEINGKKYEWLTEQSPFEFDIPSAPQWLLTLIQKNKRDYDINLSTKDRVIPNHTRGERLFEIAITAMKHGLKDEASLFAHMWAINLNHCKPPKSEKEVMTIVRSCLSYATEPEKRPIIHSEPSSTPEITVWDKSKEGKFKPTYRNALNFIKTDVKLANMIRYNKFSQTTELTCLPPWESHGFQFPKPLDDADLLQIKQYLTTFNYEPSMTTLIEAVETFSYNRSHHPVRDWMDKLTWDGVPRVETFLIDYAGASDCPYTRHCAKLMLCGAVARVYNPGCKFDYMIILEGKQGIGKSNLIKALAGRKEWFCEMSLLEKDRDLIDKMQGKWIIEVAELAAFKKKDIESLKMFITVETDIARLAYAHKKKVFPRQSIFIGSINPSQAGYFTDDENRRFLPITCGKIRYDEVAVIHDQLFAEAKAMVDKGMQLYVPEGLYEIFKVEQDARIMSDEWEQFIVDWLNDPIKTPNKETVKAGDVWKHALNGSADKFERHHQMRISGILQRFGYVKTIVRENDRQCRAYRLYSEPPCGKAVAPCKPSDAPCESQINWDE